MVEYWNNGILGKRRSVTSGRVQNPLFDYSNHPLSLVCCHPIIPIFYFSITPRLF
jgi:hypothetical protein